MARYASISWLILSVVPSDCGWYAVVNAVVNADLIPRSFRSYWNDRAANCGPLSEIILSGSPNLL